MVWQSRITTPLSARYERSVWARKNRIFFGSDHGGERGALLYGLIGRW
jgi:hypothetical protein